MTTGPVVTITSAAVAPQSATTVTEAYREVTSRLPHSVLHTSLVHGDGDDWRIITMWRSREQLQEYRRKVGTSPAVTIFRDAGAEPTVTELDVVHRAAAD
jgi:hypothetical protein